MPTPNEELQNARAAASANTWTPQRILNELESLNVLDYRFRQTACDLRDALLPGLKHALHHQTGRARLNAALLLLYLGEPEGTEGIVATLREDDDDLHTKAFHELSFLPNIKDPDPRHKPPVLPDPAAIAAALEPFLAQPDTYLGSMALHVAMRLELTRFYDWMASLIHHPSSDVRLQIVQWLGRRGQDNGALAVAETLLFQVPSKHALSLSAAALEAYCKCGHPELAHRAADVLARFVVTIADFSGNDIYNHIWKALSGIAAADYPGEAQVLQAVLNSPVQDVRRGIALERLGELEGTNGLERLQQALSDPLLCEYAAKAIAKIGRPAAHPALVNALIHATRHETRQQTLTALVDALVALGEDAPSILSGRRDRLDPHDAMRLHWLANGFTPRHAAAQLVAAGLIHAPTEALLRQLDEQWQKEHNPALALDTLLHEAEREHWFDTETSLVVVNYVDLLDDLMRISHDVFQIEAISQTHNEATGEYLVQFIYRDKVYQFRPRDFGDYYDVEAVITALNDSLHAADNPHRFLCLYTGDQTCHVIFAPAAAFLAAARTLQILLEESYAAAMFRGRGYEQHVRQQVAAS